MLAWIEGGHSGGSVQELELSEGVILDQMPTQFSLRDAHSLMKAENNSHGLHGGSS